MTITNTMICLKTFGIEILENWITQNKRRIQLLKCIPNVLSSCCLKYPKQPQLRLYIAEYKMTME